MSGHDDHYRELLEHARDALYDVLKATEPGTGLLLHKAYADLKRTIARRDEPRLRPLADIMREKREREREAYEQRDAERCARDFLKHTTPREREQHVLAILDRERLPTRALREQLSERLPQFNVYDSAVTSTVKRLYDAGDLGRVKVARGKRQVWCYFRRTELDGPIADLDRAFREGDA